MKITKARLKEIIMEELQNEGGSKGESSMADYQLNRIADLAVMIDDLVSDETDLDEWIKSKIAIVHTYLGDILDYLKGRMADAEEDEMGGEDILRVKYDEEERLAKQNPKDPMTPEEYEKYMSLYDDEDILEEG